MARRRDQEEKACAHCGELIPARARACRHCGSDANTGWLPDAAQMAGFAADDEVMDAATYEEFLRSEGLGGRKRRAKLSRQALIALVVLIAFVVTLLARGG